MDFLLSKSFFQFSSYSFSNSWRTAVSVKLGTRFVCGNDHTGVGQTAQTDQGPGWLA